MPRSPSKQPPGGGSAESSRSLRTARNGRRAADEVPEGILDEKALPSANILLVDDNEANLLALEAILDPVRQNLVRAHSGPEALKRILNQEITVILMDVVMPGMDGLETAAMIREREHSRHIPIIFMTAYDKHDSKIAHGYSLGAVDYIFKPFEPEVLRAKVSVFIELFKKTEQIKRQSELLRRSHQELEQRVLERTAELATTNAELSREVLERKRAELHLQRQATELARSNEDLAQFAYAASHDLKEPLRVVSNYAQLLEEKCQGLLDAEAASFIARMIKGTLRMNQLIDDLLAYSGIGKRKVQLLMVPLSAVLMQALENLKATLDDSQAEVTADPLPEIFGVETEMVQLFQNLIGNAIKFRGANRPRIHVGMQHNDHEWRISIRDNGIGIDPRFTERIFKIFQRLHTRDEYPGTGIGLAICKKIVQNHGGRIWVESLAGQGSTFYFTLPEYKNGSTDAVPPASKSNQEID